MHVREKRKGERGGGALGMGLGEKERGERKWDVKRKGVGGERDGGNGMRMGERGQGKWECGWERKEWERGARGNGDVERKGKELGEEMEGNGAVGESEGRWGNENGEREWGRKRRAMGR